MSLEEEDEFWNTSGVKAFNFDDEDLSEGTNLNQSSLPSTMTGLSSGVKTLGSILAAKPSSNEPFLRPSMILANCDRIEQLIEYMEKSVPTHQSPQPKQDPRSYIKDIVEKRVPIDFTPYKSKRDKLMLLDCAICCSDGNAITASTIFISKTLKSSIFIEEMKKRQIAIDHYLNYLELTGKSREALDFSRKLSSLIH